MGIIITVIAVAIGLLLVFITGVYFGQGLQVGFLLVSHHADEAYVGNQWYELYMQTLDEDETPWYGRLIARVALAGVNDVKKCYGNMDTTEENGA